MFQVLSVEYGKDDDYKKLNPVIEYGKLLVIYSNDKKFLGIKIGNGIINYNSLEYLNNNVDMSEINKKLEELFTSVSNGKSLIASAITDKGVETASDATFQTMADNISNIESIDVPELKYGNILKLTINSLYKIATITFKSFFYANKGRSINIICNDEKFIINNNDINIDYNISRTISYKLKNLKENQDNEIIISSDNGDIYFYDLIYNNFNFGDGSMNTQYVDINNPTIGAYMNSVYYYNPKNGTNNLITCPNNELNIVEINNQQYCGNFNYIMSNFLKNDAEDGRKCLLSNLDSNNQVPQGNQEVSLRNVVKGDNLSTIQMTFYGGYGWSNLSITNFKLKLDNEYYTLKQAVDNNKIEPLVLLASADHDGWIARNILNWYDGNLFGYAYSKCQCSFILKSEVEFSGVSFTNNGNPRPSYNSDGFYVAYLPYIFNII